MQQFTQQELRNSILEINHKQSLTEINMLRQEEMRTAILRHDMRHHLMMIESFLQANQPEQASAYIHQTEQTISAVLPKRFCKNEPVNLICAYYANKAEQQNIQFTATVQLPEVVPFPDTELCAILSNGLENAINALTTSTNKDPYIYLYCTIQQNRLLIEIQNPYSGTCTMRNGIPTSNQPGHGYGCRSIQAITETHHGICSFQTDNQLFILRIALPVQQTT